MNIDVLVSEVGPRDGLQSIAPLMPLAAKKAWIAAEAAAGVREIEVGITTFDSSLGGLGGCPFAPGASGKIVTEDLVFMLGAMRLRTGIDLPRLLDVRRVLREALPGEALYGFTPDAGLPLGFQPASATETTP